MPIFDDFRLSARLLRKHRGPTAVALVCIAIGVGCNVAVFSVVNSVLLRPPPYGDPDRLMMLFDTHAGPGSDPEPFVVSPPNYAFWKRDHRVFQALAAAQPASLSLAGKGEPEKVPGAAVSADLFAAMGVRPSLGRAFSAEEDKPPGRDVAILSDGLWKARFGGKPQVLGQTLRLDGKSFVVVGVMPPGFDFPDRSRVWTPLALDPEKAPERLYHLLYVVGRLNQGVSLAQAQAAMALLAGRLERELPDTNAGWSVRVQPVREYLAGDVRPALWILQAAVVLVLLIACVNVANLMLARFEHRRLEFAVRTALGESRGQLISQLFTEAVLLTLAGGGIGGFLAWLGTRAVIPLIPPEILPVRVIEPDTNVLLFALGMLVITSLLIGSVPVLKRSETDVQRHLSEAGRKSSGGGRKHRVLGSLVVVETAVAMALLVAASLLSRSFLLLKQVPPGYDARHLLTLRLTFPVPSFPMGRQRVAFLQEALAKIESLPGVRSAGATIVLPVGDRTVSAMFSVEGRPPVSPGEVLLVNNRMVSPRYLQTMRIPLLAGRYLTEADRADSQGVVVVSKEMARQYWPGQNALGKLVKRGGINSEKPWLTVVGVVADVQDTSLDAKISPTWYLPFTQHDFQEYSLAIRTDGDPLSVAPTVRSAIRSLDPDLPIEEIMTMEQRLSGSLAKQRFSALFLSLFTGIGLILAAAGIYGLMSYSVSTRMREIGIRMALGAQRRSVLAMVLGEAAVLVVTGLVVGGLIGTGLSRLLTSQLFAVQSADPVALVTAAVLLVMVGFLAGYLPANRATRINVTECFRSD